MVFATVVGNCLGSYQVLLIILFYFGYLPGLAGCTGGSCAKNISRPKSGPKISEDRAAGAAEERRAPRVSTRCPGPVATAGQISQGVI